MANNTLPLDQNANPLPLFILGNNTVQNVDGTAASAASNVIDANDYQTVRITVSADCHITSGAAPTATTDHIRMWANQTAEFCVVPGHKIAVLGAIANITTMGR